MVDFNNETTIGTPAKDIVRVLVLQARANTFEAWENYRKKLASGIEAPLSVIWARLHTWFDELQGALKRAGEFDKQKYTDVKKKLAGAKDDEMALLEITYWLNEYLDEIRITRLDTKKSYDRSNLEEENAEVGI